jgi:hypothetical protein
MKFLLAVVLLGSLNSYASHFVACELKAEVVQVKAFNRINDSVTFRRRFSPTVGSGIDERSKQITFTVTEITEQTGTTKCRLSKDQEITLSVKANEAARFVANQKLKLSFQNVGDSLGSKISWDVLD